MKDLNMLVWLTQLGLSVATPMGIFTLLGLWLKNRFQLGAWVIVVFCVIGLVCAADSFRHTLRAMELMAASGRKKQNDPPPVSFNDHD